VRHLIGFIVVANDLGVLSPGRNKGRFDAKLDRYLEEFGIDLIFIDGNHENHLKLRELAVEADGLARVRDRIRYFPRGGRIFVQGMSIGALGGAFSVDYKSRKPGVSWWPASRKLRSLTLRNLLLADRWTFC
jgi:hypothetical protein